MRRISFDMMNELGFLAVGDTVVIGHPVPGVQTWDMTAINKLRAAGWGIEPVADGPARKES